MYTHDTDSAFRLYLPTETNREVPKRKYTTAEMNAVYSPQIGGSEASIAKAIPVLRVSMDESIHIFIQQ